MEDRASRVIFALGVLVVIWIMVYWLWEPGGPAQPRDERVAVVEEPVPGVGATGGTGEPVVLDPLVPLPTPPAGTRVEPPRFKRYVVREGETLQTIARREYGSAASWTAIAQANALMDPNRLRPGREILIPLDPRNVQGREVAVTEPAGGGGSGAGRPPEAPAEPPPVIEYRVSSGDTLSGIAQRFYGSSRWTDFLFQANRDRLASPGAIRVGQTLLIPAKPGGDGP